jgi:hypothetical protein
MEDHPVPIDYEAACHAVLDIVSETAGEASSRPHDRH